MQTIRQESKAATLTQEEKGKGIYPAVWSAVGIGVDLHAKLLYNVSKIMAAPAPLPA